MRTRLSRTDLEPKVGKVLGERDYDVLLTGPARVAKPDGQPLCVYLPGVLTQFSQDPAVYEVLHSLRTVTTDNRGQASATPRIKLPSAHDGSTHRDKARDIPSTIIGAMDRGTRPYCRLTAWTGRNLPAMATIQPMLAEVARYMRQHVPARYAAQLDQVLVTRPDWVIPGTPFTTVTVNNTWPTGMHTDKGDLESGFSTIACLRRGDYFGGLLLFPEYRVAVDLDDGDLILMDAHEWHANTAIYCRRHGQRLIGWCDPRKELDGTPGCGAERISVVSYFRTKMPDCDSREAEAAKAVVAREGRRRAVA